MLQTTVCAPHGARVAWALGNGYVELPRPEKDKRSSAADVVQPDLNIRKTDRQNQKKTCSSDQTLAAALREQPGAGRAACFFRGPTSTDSEIRTRVTATALTVSIAGQAENHRPRRWVRMRNPKIVY